MSGGGVHYFVEHGKFMEKIVGIYINFAAFKITTLCPAHGNEIAYNWFPYL